MDYTLFMKSQHSLIVVKSGVGLEEAKRFYKDNIRGFYCNPSDFERFMNEQ